MQRDGQHVGPVVIDRLGAVAVVDVPVHHGHPRGMADLLASIAMGMLARSKTPWPGRAGNDAPPDGTGHRHWGLPIHHRSHGGQGQTGGQRGNFKAPTEKGIAADLSAARIAHLPECFDIVRGVYGQHGLARGRSRRGHRHFLDQPARPTRLSSRRLDAGAYRRHRPGGRFHHPPMGMNSDWTRRNARRCARRYRNASWPSFP
jgi:hypothetical protein